jgi:methyltransferase FkbM-like protein
VIAMVRTFSYQGQDLFVLEACDNLRGGYFIDSGASDGVHGSNTKLLESDYGWRGICVEPNNALYAELIANRSCICLNCCLYYYDGSVEFFEAAKVYGGIVQEYVPAHLQFARLFVARAASGEHQVALPTVLKPARTIRSVLRSCGAPQVIDYWSLDTEGSELAILRSFPFDEYRLRVLTVEHNYSSSRNEIRAFLATHGYRRVRSLGIDDGYIWVGNGDVPAWRSRVWRRPR